MEQAVQELNSVFRMSRDVIRHVLETCGGNVDLARDALRSLSYSQIQEIQKNVASSNSSTTTREESLTPLQQDKCSQFQSVASCSLEIAVKQLKKADWGIEHAINHFFESGGVVETDTTNESTSGGTSDNPESQNQVAEEIVEPPLRLEYEGLYDVTNKEYLILESTVYEVSVTDYAAEKTCIRRFINKKNNPLEIVYVFPVLDDSTSVFSVDVDIINLETKKVTRHSAEVKKNKESSEEYDDRISQGDLVLLLEKREKQKQLAQLVLGNILPKHEIVVIVRSVEELIFEDYEEVVMFEEEEEEGEDDDDDEDEEYSSSISSPKPRGGKDEEKKMMMKLRIPSLFPLLSIEEEEKEDEIEQSVKSAMAIKNITVRCVVTLFGGEIVNISSPGILLQKEKNGPSNWFVQTKKQVALTKDIVVEILVKNFPPASCIVQAIPQGIVENVSAVAMVSFIPRNKVSVEIDQEIFSEFIIVVDCSGSMAGSRIKYAREAMRCFVQSLDPEDKLKLNIVRFGSQYQQLWREPQELTDDNFHKVLDYIDNTKSNLAQTDILTPLVKVLKTDVTPSYSRQVFLLTDGEDKNTLKITQAVRRNAKSTRIFTLGIGNEINVFLIKEASRASNGKFGFIENSNQIREKVMEQLLYAAQPSVSDLEVKWPSQGEFGRVKSVVREGGLSSWVYLNERKIVYFFLEKIPSGEEEKKEKEEKNDDVVTINFVFGSAQTRNTIKVPIRILPPQSSVPQLLIGRLAATEKIDELQKYGKEKSKDVAEIEKLGLGFSLLTSETSFILKSKQQQEEGIKSNLEMVNIPTIPYIEKQPDRPQIDIPRNNNQRYPRNIKRDRGGMIMNGRDFQRSDYHQLESAGHYSHRHHHHHMMMHSRYDPDKRGLGIGSEFDKKVEEVLKNKNINEGEKKDDKSSGGEGKDQKIKLSFQEVVRIQNEEKRKQQLDKNIKKASFQEHAKAQQEYHRRLGRGRSHNSAFTETLHSVQGLRVKKIYDVNRQKKKEEEENERRGGAGVHPNDFIGALPETESTRASLGNNIHQPVGVPSSSGEEEVEGEMDIPSDMPALEPADDDEDDEDGVVGVNNNSSNNYHHHRYGGEGDGGMIAGQHNVNSPGDVGNTLRSMFYDDEDEDYNNAGDNVEDYMWSNNNGPDRPDFFDQSINSRKRRRANNNKKNNSNTKKSKKKEKDKSIKEKMDSIEGGEMNKILFTQGLNGLWVFDECFVSELLQLPIGLVIEMNPIKKENEEKEEEKRMNLSLWVSALTLVTLQRYYKNSILVWKMIAKKTERCLRKKTDINKIIKTAEMFIRKQRKR